MKAICLSLFLSMSLFTSAQDTTLDINVKAPVEDKIFQMVEEMPQYPGGEQALVKFIQLQLKYPDYAMNNNIQGRVIVEFIVNEDGSTSDINIKRGVQSTLDAEAVRVVKLFPKFTPGRQQGKPVKVKYVLPIMFRLTDPVPMDPRKKN